MARTVLIYSTLLALAAAVLQWLEFRYVTHSFSTEIYVALLGVGFVALGIWVGQRLIPRPRPAQFERNEAAVRSLGLTRRECEILQLLSSGSSLKELARTLHISPHTVKTHVTRIYEKLEVGRRVHAIEKARSLALIP